MTCSRNGDWRARLTLRINAILGVFPKGCRVHEHLAGHFTVTEEGRMKVVYFDHKWDGES